MVDVSDVDDDVFDDPGAARRRRLLRPVLVLGLYAVLFGSVLGAYDSGVGESTIVLPGLEIGLFDWVSLLSVAILVLVVPPVLARGRTTALSFVRRFARDRVAALALLGLVSFVLVAVGGTLSLGRVAFDPAVVHNPPIGTAVEGWIPNDCVGRETETACHGSWAHPFGTDDSGRDVLHAIVRGLLTSLQVGVSIAVIAGGIGTAVGVIAGTVGGRVDALLMRYVDVQSAVPAFFVFVLAVFVLNAGRPMVLLVVVFGLFSWGGFARLVRSEVVRIRDEPYVKAGRAAGAGDLYLVRHHVLPNVTSGVFVPATTLVPTYMLSEAALSYLGVLETPPYTVSLGEEIAHGFAQQYTAWWRVWWDPVLPAVALTLLILCLLVVGDRMNEVLDPRDD